MPRDGAGNYSLPASYLVASGDTVLPIQHNPPFEDVAQALTGSLARNGAGAMLADLSFGGFKGINLAAGVADTDAATVGQLSILLGGNVRNVANRTQLKALDTTLNTLAYLREGNREGVFAWRTGNYSSQIAADTLEGIYVKANAVASSAGAWIRVVNGAVDPRWWGAVADNATDDLAALQAAANSGYEVDIVGFFRVSGAITLPVLGCTFKGLGASKSRITTTSSTADIITNPSTGAVRVIGVAFSTTVDKTAGVCINSANGSYRDFIKDCMFFGASASVMLWNAIFINGLLATIESNYFLNVKNTNITLRNNTGDGGSETVVSGNIFNTITPTNPSGNGSTGIYWDGGDGPQRFVNNLFQNVDYGIVVSLLSGVTQGALHCHGNQFINNKNAGVTLSLPSGSSSVLDEAIISGCTFRETTGGASILIAGATNTAWIRRINIQGNTINYSDDYTVNVQVGGSLLTGGNIFQASVTNKVAILVANALPVMVVFGVDAFRNTNAPYFLNGRTTATKPSMVTA